MGKEYDFTGAARKLKITLPGLLYHVRKGHIKWVYRAHLGNAGKRMITDKDLQVFIWSEHYKREEVE
ncbi:hypothetical protein LCGC14_1574040 [marine sediment metagenome]|uniref:Helix-turn-helix domain-containing protein n=1 Tax=marine sediment metagenome TaxID=412755 RepID=A0A0F9J552_9ZZZZ